MTEQLQVATTPWSWHGLGSADALCTQAERAEAMGFHSFWLPENHFGGARAIPSPLMLLAAIAGRTRRIKLGCTSYLLPIRNPLLAAEEVAVLDRLCEGRLILGLGRGIGSSMFKAFNIPVADKRKLFQSKLEIMRSAWRGEPVAEDEGEPIVLSPLPLQQPSPPIWVAAFGPLALQQVASLGLPYLASPVEPLEVLEKNYRRYHASVQEADLPVVTTVPVMRTIFITASRKTAKDVKTRLAGSVPRALQTGAAVDEWAIVGDRAHARDKLSEYVERLGMSHLILRGGIPGVAQEEQLNSHENLLSLAADL